MEELLNWMEYIEDVRQKKKVRHLLKDILVIVLFATLANADDWVEIALFAQVYEEYLKKYIELKNGPPSHDTIQRVMGMISPDILQQLYGKWQELLNREEGEALKKIICIDGKTMRSNKQGKEKPSHIVTAWSREDGFSLGQKAVSEKSNEITAIPELIERLQIKGQIITIDVMGTQTVIVEKSGEKGQIETREYYQTEDIRWMIQKKDWKGLKSIAMERKSIEKNGRKKTEYRYFISSLKGDIETISRAVRGHWSIESMHWHLDVTFREDANTTLDKMSAQNLNIIRKWSLSILKLMELTKKKLSMKKKRFVISLSPIKYLEEVLDF